MARATAVRRSHALAFASALAAAWSWSAQAAAPAPQLFKERWIAGNLAQEPVVQVQALDDDTFVIRQSIKTNFEAPFLYLMFGRDKALMIDTGAQGGQIRPVVDRLVAEWLLAKHRSSIPLVVAHSHSHGDHIAGDGAFRDRPETVVVGLQAGNVAEFFGVANWPDGIATFDLGGRPLKIIPTPGHQKAAIAVYDSRLQILLSGDTIYPGRLYVPVNFLAEERASVDRLAAFAASHPIRALLGAHIEMTVQPGRDYAHEVLSHAAEHVLELPVGTIGELQEGLKADLDVPDRPQVHDNFIIYPVPARTE
ncbi:MBL fold metallo-hydrolase [Novosphingobium sp. PP1Y]|uniref:MBL fold metallo-hydrolase n=1 Tax=Novosphingobium sp. PP1Y TaxID=702113 RepID=UPI00020EF82B|nr:MBL fold metallo-hydrolase [Novosphingobium sp. PP1Y]CCA90181.1 beta-lactamase-like [Novosphingobium sp. PP1Y]